MDGPSVEEIKAQIAAMLPRVSDEETRKKAAEAASTTDRVRLRSVLEKLVNLTKEAA